MSANIEFEVLDEPPPLKGEAKSMLSEGHKQGRRVRELLQASHEAKLRDGFDGFGAQRIGMELVVSLGGCAGDATNALGGIGDTLQSRRANIDITYLGPLADAFLYEDDAQIREVTYREDDTTRGYRLRFWTL
jgi:hypothetical protein